MYNPPQWKCDIPEGVTLCYNFVNVSPVYSLVCVCLRSHEKEINSDAFITWNRMPPSKETDPHIAAGVGSGATAFDSNTL